jgi:glycosyltransferase involved in cell wall biosynthesis
VNTSSRPSARPIRVLHVGPSQTERGGIASVLGELAMQRESFARQGISLGFFETHGFQSLSGMLLFILLDMPRFLFVMAGRFDIVHFHVSVHGSFYRKFLLFMLARFLRRKTIFHLHSGAFRNFRDTARWPVRIAIDRFIRKADAAIAVASATGEELRRWGGDQVSLCVIGNTALSAESAESASTALAGVLPAASPQAYVAFVGRLTEGKGVMDLLKAVALLKARGCFVELRLAGMGDIDRWRLATAMLGIEDRVVFVGWLEGAAKLAFVRHARVFCMPSHHESFGIATLEAMFSAVPVIGTRLGGFLDLVVDDVTGYLVPPHDPEALAERIAMFVNAPALAESMGQAGLRRASQQFSSVEIIDKYIECYRQVSGLGRSHG